MDGSKGDQLPPMPVVERAALGIRDRLVGLEPSKDGSYSFSPTPMIRIVHERCGASKHALEWVLQTMVTLGLLDQHDTDRWGPVLSPTPAGWRWARETQPQKLALALTQSATSEEWPGLAPRDAKFLEWWETEGSPTYHSPARIRDRWQALTTEERKAICPKRYAKISAGAIRQALYRVRRRRKKGQNHKKA